MPLFWRGYGWLVPIIIYATFFVSQFLVDAFHGEGSYAATSWPQYMATYIGAFLLGVFGYVLNYVKREDLIDEETGESVGSRRHTRCYSFRSSTGHFSCLFLAP